MSLGPSSLKHFPDSTTALKPLQDKLKDLNIDDLMQHQDLLELFRQHCLRERSLENIMFLESVYEFEVMPSSERSKASRQIFDTFFIPGGTFELNLSQEQKDYITRRVKSENITPDMFDDVYQTIAFELKDVWSRFKDSAAYKTYKPKQKIQTLKKTFEDVEEVDIRKEKSDPTCSPTTALDDFDLSKLYSDVGEPLQTKKTRMSIRKSLRKLSSSSDEVERAGCRKSLAEVSKFGRKSIEKNVIRQLEQEYNPARDGEMKNGHKNGSKKKKEKCFLQ